RVSQGPDNDQIVGSFLMLAPKVAGQHCDRRRLPLGLPTCGQKPRELGLVCENQHVEVWQEGSAPKFVSGLIEALQFRYSFSASSSADSKRFVLIPKFTAASVSLACLATSTRSWSRDTSIRATDSARSRAVALPVCLAASVAAVTSARATTARLRSSAEGP